MCVSVYEYVPMNEVPEKATGAGVRGSCEPTNVDADLIFPVCGQSMEHFKN